MQVVRGDLTELRGNDGGMTREMQPEYVMKRVLLHREATAKPYKLRRIVPRGLHRRRHPSVRDNASK
jgi:hypothetical protein